MDCFLRRFDLFANFMELLISEKPLEGFHIVVDAGNGAGGFFAVSFLCNLILPFVFTHSQLYESF